MTINFTLQHFAGFMLLAAIATIFFQGWLLIRILTWTFLWQLLTPSRDWLVDGLMLSAGFWVTEYLYKCFSRVLNAPPP